MSEEQKTVDEQVDENGQPIIPNNDQGTPENNNDGNVVNIDNVDYKVDAEGNALDAAGNIFKTKEELATFEEVNDKVTVGEVQYTKDAEGNLLDDDGEIVYTKEEAVNVDVPISIVHLMETTNIKPVDSKGNRIIYPDTTEGHVAYINDIATIQSNNAVNKAFSDFLTNNPDIKAVIEYKRTYGSLDNYNPKTDFTNITLDKDKVDVLESVILTARMKRGDTPETAQRYIDYLKKENILFEEAQKDHAFIKESQLNDARLLEARELKDSMDRQNANIKYWNEVQTTIKNGVIKVDGKEYQIPKIFQIEQGGKKTTATSEDFFMYMYQPIKMKDERGNEIITTRLQLDEDEFYNKNGVNATIFNALSLFTKKPTAFIEAQLKTERSKQIKKYVSTVSNKNKQTDTTVKTGGKIDYN